MVGIATFRTVVSRLINSKVTHRTDSTTQRLTPAITLGGAP